MLFRGILNLRHPLQWWLRVLVTPHLAHPVVHVLDAMQEQVCYLKAVIHTRDEELRRKDHIIAALTELIPELQR